MASIFDTPGFPQPPKPQFGAHLTPAAPPRPLNAPIAQSNALPPVPAPAPAPPQTRTLGDATALRQAIFERALESARSVEPIKNELYTLSLSDVDYAGPERYTKADHKKAVLTRGSLARKLQGTWTLVDNKTNETVAQRKATLASVPYLTESGTFVNKGVEYTLAHQMRLRPGVYAREKDNGELEAHVNTLPGKGRSHRYQLDPATGVFKINIGQASIPLFPLLKTLGVSEHQIRDAWGNDLASVNMQQGDAGTLEKLYQRLSYKPDANLDATAKMKAVTDEFAKMQLDPEVTKRTLGKAYDRMTPEAVLDITKKLIKLNKKEIDPDDRDSMTYQTVVGPEDLLAERFVKDKTALRQLLWKATAKKNLDHVPTGVFNKAITAALIGSGLGSSPEEVNPLEIFDLQQRVTRLGEGGIGSLDAVPAESRAVQPSHFGFVDFLRSPESGKAGVDMRFANGAVKGRDGKIYTPVRDIKTGETVLKTPQELADLPLAFPGFEKSDLPMVPAIVNGKMEYVSREEAQYTLPSMDNSFSQLSNMIPLKSMVKGQRAIMGARMLTQALPLENAEAPFVQSAMSSDLEKSYEDDIGGKLGAVRAEAPAQVISVTADEIVLRDQNGEKKTIELHNELPLNRKTSLSQTATVKPGDVVQPGQLLATSNFTDKNGSAAVGLNMRVAYLPYRGKNYEDAIVISESAAKRLSSQHMYQHEAEWDENVKRGKNAFVSIFPQTYDKKILENFDEHGAIKKGTTVNYGDPLVLIAKERPAVYGKVHGGRKSNFVDESVTWEHHSPGVVTDVEHTKKGVAVVVKNTAKMEVADKLSGRYGNKGTISDVIPDDQMPKDSQGRPFEVLVSPLGLISRVNPAQVIETVLGKIAEKTGKPFKLPDFDDSQDLIEFAQKQLRLHNLSDTEDVEDPETGRKIKGVLAGNSFFMKLHHTAESKIQGRATGAGYTAEGTPAKGGVEGAKRVGLLNSFALLSHGAGKVIRDAKMVRGQANPEYWSQFMGGYDTPLPKVPHVYNKFVNQLKASGINVVRTGTRTNIMALTDKDVDELAGDREIENAETVDWKGGMRPKKGGLFDEALTGGLTGCFHPQTRILTRTGWQTIGAIVNKRLPVEVLTWSFDAAKLEWKPVTNYFKHTTATPLLRVKFGGGGLSGVFSSHAVWNSVYCTGDHAFYRDDGTKVRADDLSDYVLMPTCTLGRGQKSAFYGTLLGDASVVMGRDHNACLSFQHGLAQEAYLRHKAGLFGGFIQCDQIGVTTEKAYVSSAFTAEFGELHKKWYTPLGKRLPADFFDVADRITLALWYFDDGWTSQAYDGKYVSGFCTQGFSREDVEQLRGWLQREFQIQTGCHARADGSGWVISLARAATARLFLELQDLCPPGMEYKLPTVVSPCWRPTACFEPSAAVIRRPLRFVDASGKCKNAYRVKYVYDIEVADNHNYFANGVLVSNSRWSKITLHEALPSPVMEEPVRRVLGLTQKQFRAVLAGDEKIGDNTGPGAIQEALANINLPKAIEQARADIKSGRATVRDAAVRRLGFLKAAETTGVQPKDWMMTKVPVLPPMFRPVSVMGAKKLPLVSDANYLYKELLEANNGLKSAAGVLSKYSDERLNVYDAVKAVTGLGDPTHAKNVERKVKGFLQHVFGGSPKHGTVQRQLLSTTVDLVGRAVINPNPDLDMDEVAIPEDKAWEIYKPFVVRSMVRSGMPRMQALDAVKNRTKAAGAVLQQQMSARPVIVDRAPVLHRYGMMALKPRLTKNKAMELSPIVTKGFGADFDGDAMQFHVPSTPEAAEEAMEKMLPSRNLFSVSQFKAHYLPNKDYQVGLYLASARQDKKTPPKVYADTKAAIAAYKRGEISVDTPVHIVDNKGS